MLAFACAANRLDVSFCCQNLEWEAQQKAKEQAKQNQTAASKLLNRVGAAVPEPIKLQVRFCGKSFFCNILAAPLAALRKQPA